MWLLAAQAAGLVMARSGILIAEPNKVQFDGGICQGLTEDGGGSLRRRKVTWASCRVSPVEGHH